MDIKAKLSYLYKTGKLKFLLIILICGIVLLVIAGRYSDKLSSPDTSVMSHSEGESSLEQKIRVLCESVNGVSSVSVAVSLDRDGNIIGVGIVCRGGSDPTIQRELIPLVSAACGVGSNRIFITEAQK
jgi:hypothetical protein